MDNIGLRIKSARAFAGLSLRQLAEKLEGKVSHTALHKFEKGELEPNPDLVSDLARLLGVRFDYFYRPNSLEIEKIEFRRKSTLPQKRVQAIKEQVKDEIERYIELEQILDIQKPFENPISSLMINSGDDVELAVEQLLERWNLGQNALPNVIELLEDKEIKVAEIEADLKFDGFSGWVNEHWPVVVINRAFTTERKRFTALHELGHILLKFNSDLSDKEIEKLCHRFAGAMLLPKQTFIREFGRNRNHLSINELRYIGQSYGISIRAIMARANTLGLISAQKYRSFNIYLNQDNHRKNSIDESIYKGIEHPTRFYQLLYHATAEEFISMSKAATLANLTLSDFRNQYQGL